MSVSISVDSLGMMRFSSNTSQQQEEIIFVEAADPYDLNRFVQAQACDYARALDEVRKGKKQTHWMWYIFPQYDGLGITSESKTYAIKSVAEAKAYLSHPILGQRLIECCEAAVAVDGKSASEIFGFPDDVKLRSCATLFAVVSSAGSVFARLLAKYFDGMRDEKTVHIMAITATTGDSNTVC